MDGLEKGSNEEGDDGSGGRSRRGGDESKEGGGGDVRVEAGRRNGASDRVGIEREEGTHLGMRDFKIGRIALESS